MELLVLDIGGTSVKYGIWTHEQLESKGFFQTPATWAELKQAIVVLVDELSQEKKIQFDGLAISSPGSVDTDAGIVKGFSAVPYIHFFPIREELEQALKVPVSIENDANCAALAELWLGAARSVENAIFIVIGTGIGGAVIMDGKLVKGRNLFGGEFGYMLLDEGNTFSDLASPVNAARRYSLETGAETVISGQELFQRAEQGEALALEHVNRLKDNLARGIQMLLVSFNPDKVIIGGGISSRIELATDLTERVTALLKRTHATDVEVDIVPCEFKNDANLLGAVSVFMTNRI